MTKKLNSVMPVAILFVSSLLLAGCSTKSADANPTIPAPHKTDVYFITVGQKGDLRAYISEGSVNIGRVSMVNLTQPYVEVKKGISDGQNRYLGKKGEEYIEWGFGGTLYIKDLEQLKSLTLVK